MNYTILDEGTLREVTMRDEAAGGRRFDPVMIGPDEARRVRDVAVPAELRRMASSDRAYNLGDIIRRYETPCRTRASSTRRRSTGSRPS